MDCLQGSSKMSDTQVYQVVQEISIELKKHNKMIRVLVELFTEEYYQEVLRQLSKASRATCPTCEVTRNGST